MARRKLRAGLWVLPVLPLLMLVTALLSLWTAEAMRSAPRAVSFLTWSAILLVLAVVFVVVFFVVLWVLRNGTRAATARRLLRVCEWGVLGLGLVGLGVGLLALWADDALGSRKALTLTRVLPVLMLWIPLRISGNRMADLDPRRTASGHHSGS